MNDKYELIKFKDNEIELDVNRNCVAYKRANVSALR